MNRTIELADNTLRRLRFTAMASRVLACVMLIAVALELIDEILAGFDAFALIPLGLQLGFAAAIGLAGLWLHNLTVQRQHDDLERALLALRLYFAAHGILFIAGVAIGTLLLLVYFLIYAL